MKRQRRNCQGQPIDAKELTKFYRKEDELKTQSRNSAGF